MRGLLVLAAVSMLGYAGVSAQAATPGFRYGVAAGDVRSASALLWTRAPAPGRLTVTVTPRGGVSKVFRGRAPRANDATSWWESRR